MKYLKIFLLIFILSGCFTKSKQQLKHVVNPKISIENKMDSIESIKTTSENLSEEHEEVIVGSSGSYAAKPSVNYIIKTDTVKSLEQNYGVISYFVPDTMEISQTYIIRLRIANQYSKEILQNINNNQSGSATVDSIHISNDMKAFLSDVDNAFSIVVLSTTDQNIDSTGYTEWEWSVTPKNGGNKNLRLRVLITGKVNKDIEVFNDVIHIDVPISYRVSSFFNNNWEWLISTLIIPLIGWWYNRKRKKKKKV